MSPLGGNRGGGSTPTQGTRPHRRLNDTVRSTRHRLVSLTIELGIFEGVEIQPTSNVSMTMTMDMQHIYAKAKA